jgi:hypothetical protein
MLSPTTRMTGAFGCAAARVHRRIAVATIQRAADARRTTDMLDTRMAMKHCRVKLSMPDSVIRVRDLGKTVLSGELPLTILEA